MGIYSLTDWKVPRAVPHVLKWVTHSCQVGNEVKYMHMKTMICLYTIKIVQIWDIVYLETQGMDKLSISTPFPVTLISYPRLWKIFCSQFNQVQHNWFCIIDIDIFDDLDLWGDIDLWPKGLNFLKRDFQISIRFVKFLALFNYLMTLTFVVTLTLVHEI